MSKIIVYCGEDIVSSRKEFLEYLKKFSGEEFELIRVNGKDLEWNQFLQFLESNSLFQKRKILVIENFLAGPNSKIKEDVINYLQKKDSLEIIFWEAKDFSAKERLKFPQNFTFKNFALPEMIFDFLDNLRSNKPKTNLQKFLKAVQFTDPSFLFLMLARQIRLLILAKEKKFFGILPWQRTKLENQVNAFTKEQLTEIYHKLLLIDFNQKTSNTPLDLKSELDLLIAGL